MLFRSAERRETVYETACESGCAGGSCTGAERLDRTVEHDSRSDRTYCVSGSIHMAWNEDHARG